MKNFALAIYISLDYPILRKVKMKKADELENGAVLDVARLMAASARTERSSFAVPRRAGRNREISARSPSAGVQLVGHWPATERKCAVNAGSSRRGTVTMICWSLPPAICDCRVGGTAYDADAAAKDKQ